jgi:hypothetical protein
MVCSHRHSVEIRLAHFGRASKDIDAGRAYR